MKPTIQTLLFPLLFPLLSLPLLAGAHFQLTYPPSRGDNDQTQTTSPCGGLDTPSTTRTPWSLTGGQLKFEAGHDEADTAVYLALGNRPSREDFTIILAQQFKQVGLGTFCWNDLPVPNGVQGIRVGVNATIQVVQAGHTGGGLYNCADITFVSATPSGISACSNSSGVSAETVSHSSNSSASASSSSTSTAAGSAGSGKSSDGNVNAVAAGVAVMAAAGVVAAVGGWVL
ncbi:hypothetical protein L873DRAFT_1685138 [Choiromyces venosus 120613-1]|uniref:Copper acquisition factor BIM1-like domain-containing protein n=1 Tax=Choiromyces venosus 120613-1 TaxID=1336337 RepID=A0A3N4JSJ1_9PEZI|nr:hypothetical protein L873DRAFT_1685138 [Choiromyces venosus 120613-1]